VVTISLWRIRAGEVFPHRPKTAYAGSHLGYARLLANTNHIPEAVKQAQAAVEADPQSAPGHQLWGDLLAAQGDWDGAARELQAAVALAPNLWGAQYDLGAVLAQKGDAVAAIGHLKIAASGTDPAAKASALELLQKLGR
jgi:tetratricopeptide (TPR) repeat protein